MAKPKPKRIERRNVDAMLKHIVNTRMSRQGEFEVGIPGVTLFRRDHTHKAETTLYSPLIVKIVQGSKRIIIGSHSYWYGEDDILVAGLDVPGVTTLCEATPQKPCTAIVLDLDIRMLVEMAPLVSFDYSSADPMTPGIFVQKADDSIFDAFLRLAELFDQPEQSAVLAPLAIREIHYRLLSGPNGQWLHSFYTQGTRSNQIERVIAWLKENVTTPVNVEDLARRANMAPSTFHRRFKDMTTMSPLQFQKNLRLHEAQRLMLLENHDASSAGLTVGYDNLSQFTREYKRLFGEPPRRDIARLWKEAIRPQVKAPFVQQLAF